MLIKLCKLKQQRLKHAVVFIFRQRSLVVTQSGDLQFDTIPPSPQRRLHFLLGIAPYQVKLMRPQTIQRCTITGALDCADTPKPVGGRSQSVRIVIQQRMLGRQPSLRLVEVGHVSRGDQIGFQKGRLPILVQIRRRIANRFAHEAAKTGKVLFEQERLDVDGAYFASPIAAGGNIYFASTKGIVTVIEPGDTLKVIARNDLEEAIPGTPAVAGDALYLRSANHLWAFGR